MVFHIVNSIAVSNMEEKPVVGAAPFRNDSQEVQFQGSRFDVKTLRYEVDGADETVKSLASSMGKWSSLRRSQMPRMNDLENGSGEEDDGDVDDFTAGTSSMTSSVALKN